MDVRRMVELSGVVMALKAGLTRLTLIYVLNMIRQKKILVTSRACARVC
jgi:hypothetical protein